MRMDPAAGLFFLDAAVIFTFRIISWCRQVSFEGIIVGGGTRLTDPRFFSFSFACGSVNGLIFPFLSAAGKILIMSERLLERKR